LLEERLTRQAESKIGIFNIVNDCSTQKPRPTWNALIQKFKDNHKGNLCIQFEPDKARDKFVVMHSAKDVKYDVKSFIERNVDDISQSLETLIMKKTDPIIQNVAQNKVPGLKVTFTH